MSARPNRWMLGALALVALTACTPPTPEQIAAQCEERARAAQGPSASLRLGVGTEGTTAGGSISFSSDYLAGRSPEEVYETCVRDRTGQPPVRPLVL